MILGGRQVVITLSDINLCSVKNKLFREERRTVTMLLATTRYFLHSLNFNTDFILTPAKENELISLYNSYSDPLRFNCPLVINRPLDKIRPSISYDGLSTFKSLFLEFESALSYPETSSQTHSKIPKKKYPGNFVVMSLFNHLL